MQRSFTAARSSALCMFASAGYVRVDVGRALTALVSAVHRCGSPWACPICAPVIRQHRALEIDAALALWMGQGHGCEFVTNTLSHHLGDTLESRLAPISNSLGLMLMGAGWKRRKARLGYVGGIKAIDITHGEVNGWHPHSHSLLLFERPLTDDERADLEAWMFMRWSTVAAARNLGEVSRSNGLDVKPITRLSGVGDYLAKFESAWSPGMEIARSDLKGRAPIQLLRTAVATGEVEAIALWREYEAATFGRRAIRWSPGLRRRILGVEQETTDQELAASEGLDLALLRALIPAEVWDAAVKAGTAGRVLTEIEQVAAVLLFIGDVLGIEPEPLDRPVLEVVR